MQGKVVGSIVVKKIAQAIAGAEGFYIKNSRGSRNHNPGNLSIDLGAGAPATGMDGILVVFPDDATGWANLEKQVRLMFGGSTIYNQGMSIADVASRYTTTEQEAWARNVAKQLGVPVSTRLSEIV